MKKALLIGVGGLLTLIVLGFYIFSQTSSTSKSEEKDTSTKQAQEKTDTKASFAIFTNGIFRIFTNSMYHNLSEDVYIEASNPNIVQIKKANTTWEDFFNTLPMTLSPDCLTTGTGQTFCTNNFQILKFYINGELDNDALNKIINEGDQLLVSYGDENDAEIEEQIDKVPNL